jgi:nucleolar protein 15
MKSEFAVPNKKSTKKVAPTTNKRKRNDAQNNTLKKKKLVPTKEIEQKESIEKKSIDLNDEVDDELILENPETSSDTFSFEEDSQSDSQVSQTSTDLSSSVTDEFAAQVAEIKLDKNVEDKMKERIKKETKITKKEVDEPKGVVYLGRLPYGFFEEQLRGFFNQFGDVTRLRLSRSKKSGRSKSYCFIEFEDPIVATIVADTMNGYIMFGRSLKCQVIPQEKIHPKMFVGANKKFFPKKTRISHINSHNSPKSKEQLEKNINNMLKKEEKKREKLKELGINYNFPGIKSLIPEKTIVQTN